MNQQVRSLKPGQRVYLNGGQEALTYNCGDLVARGRKILLTSLADTDVLTNCFGDTINMYGGEVIEAAPATNNIALGIIDKSGRVINPPRHSSQGESGSFRDEPYLHYGGYYM